MSNSSQNDRLPFVGETPSVPSAPSIRKPVAGAAFWAAIALPFLHLPLLATGLETTTTTVAFLVLLGLNVLTLLIGHSYHRD